MSNKAGERSVGSAIRGIALCSAIAFVGTACSSDPMPVGGSEPAAAIARGQGFATPEAAVQALGELAGTGEFDKAEAILGPGSVEVLRSGDPVADRADSLRVQGMIAKRLAFEDVDDDRKIALLGEYAWPFAIPLVRDGGLWYFDVESGREELANRRVGRNELRTIATLHAIVDGQRKYASVGRDGATPRFARKVVSSEGKRDGLYWPTGPGESESPLGPEVAEASAEGYVKSEGERPPFHGYYFRLLLEQGPSAPGGARKYEDANGALTRGFAAVAWPSRWQNSGVKTFLVSQRGVVYEKDLGEDTASVAASITVFDPDETWTPVVE